MKFNQEITYSTGEFAAHFGVKKDTLLYYDKINLFRPAGVYKNGYRYYTASQIEPFRTLLSLRELNVPVKVLQDYFQAPSPEKLAELTARQLQQVAETMQKLEQIQSLLKQISAATEEGISAEFGKTRIEVLPPVYLIYSPNTNSDLETSEEQWAEVHDDFILRTGLSGISNVGSVLSESDLMNGIYNRIDRLYAETSHRTGQLREGGEFAVFYHKGPYDHVERAYQKLFEQLQELGYMAVGDAYEEYLIAETASSNEEEYVTKIMIRVRCDSII